MSDAEKIGLPECPLCGGDLDVIRRGNDHTKSREVTVKCSRCRLQRTDKAVRHGFDWLEKGQAEWWNKRSPETTRKLAAFEKIITLWHGSPMTYESLGIAVAEIMKKHADAERS